MFLNSIISQDAKHCNRFFYTENRTKTRGAAVPKIAFSKSIPLRRRRPDKSQFEGA